MTFSLYDFFHNVIIHISKLPISNKDQTYYYYNIFLEKCFYHISKNNDNK